MKHPDPAIQAERDEAAYRRYDAAITELGTTLKRAFPAANFSYHEPSKMWLTECPDAIKMLLAQFDFAYTDYLANWRKFLNAPKLIVLGHDCDDWFGFTID